MKEQKTMQDLVLLIDFAVKNGVEIKFLDYKNPEHNEWRSQCIQQDYAGFYADMSISDMYHELANCLRHHGKNPMESKFQNLRLYYESKVKPAGNE